MRLVALADTHTFHDRVQVPDGDVLVHAGDLCRGGDLDELAQAVDWLRSLPHATKIVVAGNHDGSFQENRQAAVACCGKEIIYLEDSETSVEGIRFWGSPWQPAYNDWAFNLERGTPLARKWALIPSRIDVLITHGPPFGIGDRSSVAGRHGCEDLLSRVHEVRPRLHIFGHIHEDGGVWRRDGILFANVTTWEGERPVTIFEMEPGPGNAVDDIFVPEALVPSCADWHSPAGGR